MLHKLKMNTFTSRDYAQKEKISQISIDWAVLLKAMQYLVLLMIPITAIVLSVLSNYLFFKEMLSASFLLVLILFIKIASGKS